jgi:hypothetical protein
LNLVDAEDNFARPAAASGTDLRQAAVRGVAATFLSGSIGLGIQMGSVVVLGRLLALWRESGARRCGWCA